MDGWNSRRFLVAFGSAALMILGASAVRADWVAATEVRLSAHGIDAEPRLQNIAVRESLPAPVDGRVLWNALRSEWETIREELTQSVVEATVTTFFIRGGKPPAPPKKKKPNVTPPAQDQGDPPVVVPPPPPPEGQGETPQIGPPIDPPLPQETPEPATLVTALLGAGAVSWFTWRRRRRNPISRT